MAYFTRRFIFCATLISSTLVSVPQASAGPLLDWLFGRRNAAPVACANCGPTQVESGRQITSYSVPTTQYAPAYRTVWQRVPVTNYRPNVQYDSTSGRNITTLRPCADYEWQTRRVPVQSYRPVLGWLFGQSPAYAARPAYRVPTSTYAYSSPTSSYANPADCGTGSSRILQQKDDYYAPRGTTGQSRLGAEEGWEDVRRDGAGGPDAPRFAPDADIPTPDYSNEKTGTPAVPQSLRGQDSATKRAPRAAMNQPQGTRRTRPVLDPEPSYQTERPSPPQLIRPRVKTAVARPQAGSFVLVSWPERGDTRVRRANLSEPLPENVNSDKWEDDGFRGVK